MLPVAKEYHICTVQMAQHGACNCVRAAPGAIGAWAPNSTQAYWSADIHAVIGHGIHAFHHPATCCGISTGTSAFHKLQLAVSKNFYFMFCIAAADDDYFQELPVPSQD